MNRGQYAVLALESMRKLCGPVSPTVRQQKPITISSVDWCIEQEFGFDVSALSKDTKRRALEDLMELGFVRREKRSYYLVRSPRFPADPTKYDMTNKRLLCPLERRNASRDRI